MTNTFVNAVTVVGAGLGGLTTAAILQRHGVDVVVYDLDAGPYARPQGGMLDIHEESGQAALRAAGLHARFTAQVLPGGQAMRILDEHATVHWDESDGGDRPEIQREALRALLLEALAPGTVRWGHKLVAAHPERGGRHRLEFADASTAESRVLVGADGAWSRVRPLVSDARPAYTGVSFVSTRLHDVDDRHPGPAALVGGGLFFALGDRRGLLAHREPNATIEVYAALTTSPDWVEHVGSTAGEALLAEFAHWDPRLRALVAEADAPFLPLAIHALPVSHRWHRAPGVTLLGDAAHLMSPFAGEGANLAMADGADLAAALLRHDLADPDAVDAALRTYEETLFPRAEAAAAESAANLDIAFRPDAPRGFVERMAAYAGPSR